MNTDLWGYDMNLKNARSCVQVQDAQLADEAFTLMVTVWNRAVVIRANAKLATLITDSPNVSRETLHRQEKVWQSFSVKAYDLIPLRLRPWRPNDLRFLRIRVSGRGEMAGWPHHTSSSNTKILRAIYQGRKVFTYVLKITDSNRPGVHKSNQRSRQGDRLRAEPRLLGTGHHGRSRQGGAGSSV